MKNIYLSIFSVILLSLTACQRDEEAASPVQKDKLQEFGILGNWEINNRLINGVSDMLPLCCEYLEFKTDGNKGDLIGKMTYEDPTRVLNGTFVIEEADMTIEFIFDDSNFKADLEMKDDEIRLVYEEAGNTIDDSWKRQ